MFYGKKKAVCFILGQDLLPIEMSEIEFKFSLAINSCTEFKRKICVPMRTPYQHFDNLSVLEISAFTKQNPCTLFS